MKVRLTRTEQNDKQSLGVLQIIDGYRIAMSCFTLELPDRNNEPQVSCIPTGSYQVKKRTSPKFREHFHIVGVPNRSYILIHAGNYHTGILGCVLVGSGYRDINNDNITDVINSKKTLVKLLDILPSTFELEIR